MLRNVLGVIVGYIAIAAIVFVGLAVAFFVLGVDKVYEPLLFDVTMLWIIVMLAVGFLAAFIGGAVCKMIARSPKGSMALAVVVLVLGGVMAAVEGMKETPAVPPVRTGETSMTEAMMNSKQPMWVSIANPIIGVIGVMIGASIIKGRDGSAN